MRGPEGKFQDRFLAALRGQGMVCQKFNDLYSEGIPDTMGVLPLQSLPFNWMGPIGAWMELKAITSWPLRAKTKLPTKSKPTAGQIRWMTAFHTRQMPCYAILDTPDGWIAVEHTQIEWLWALPWPEVKRRVSDTPISYGTILRSANANKV
jgi:hypothetical protein